MSIDPARHQAQVRALQVAPERAPRQRRPASTCSCGRRTRSESGACSSCQKDQEAQLVASLTVEQLLQIIAAVLIGQTLSQP